MTTRITIEAARTPAGRLEGCILGPAGSRELPFSGTLELLACIETLLDADPESPPAERAATTR